MVDYSKWDKFGDDEEEEINKGPVVTTFDGDKGRSFVIGPGGASLVKLSPGDTTAIKSTENKPQLDSSNGGITSNFVWSQDRHEVCIQREISSTVKASDITVIFDASEYKLSVSDKQHGELFSGILRYKFEINEEDSLSPIQWELKDISNNEGQNHRVFIIDFKKVSPIPGSIIWWKNIFVDDDEIDVTIIPGREKPSKEVAGAWDEAHKLFKDRLATREKIIVDLDDEESEA